jgi:dTDP-4-dehydrorhamnose reductase
MLEYIIFGGNGMLASAFKENAFFSDSIAPDINECDITDMKQIEVLVKEHKPKYLINCAAYTDVTGAEKDLDIANKINGEATKNLAIIAKDNGCKLIHFSTDFVFKGDKEIVYSETTAVNPVNNYGLSKLKGEENVQKYGSDYLIIRISWLYGKNGKNFVSSIINLMEHNNELKIVSDQFGKTTYTDDVTECVKTLITQEERGIFHFANEGMCSRYDFTLQINEIYKQTKRLKCSIYPIKASEYNDLTPRPKWSVLSCEKYERVTRQKCRHYQDAVSDYIKEIIL